MRKKLYILLPFLFLGLSHFVMADNIEPTHVQFSPPRYYVGDTVKLSFQFDLDPTINLVMPLYQDDEFICVDRIDFERQDRTVFVLVTLRFFSPGTRSVQFSFGSLTTDPIPFHVSSILNNTPHELCMPYGPLSLPGTRLLGTIFIAFIVLLPFIIYFSLHALKFLMAHVVFRRSPYSILTKKLKILSLDKNKLTDKVFYTKLLEALRGFLAGYSHCEEFKSATASRMYTLLLAHYSEEETRELMDIIHRGDMVKFGGEQMQKGERPNCIKKIQKYSKQLIRAQRGQE